MDNERVASFVDSENHNGIPCSLKANEALPSVTTMLHTEAKYQLIDFGHGRKLEKVGGLILNRPCPGAKYPPAGSPLWGQENLVFDQISGRWRERTPIDFAKNPWKIAAQGLTLKLRPTAAGQIGIFPEHWQHWDWLASCLGKQRGDLSSMRVLSLFAYTGATTLFLAQKGVQVTHVDSSKPTVAWARESCHLSGLESATIRWLVEDAVRYVEREAKRGHRYDAIILDPPTYGHGTRDETWNIYKHLSPLLSKCWELLSDERCCVLLCGHSPDIDLKQLARELGSQVGKQQLGVNTIMQAGLEDSFGRMLDCGFACRFEF